MSDAAAPAVLETSYYAKWNDGRVEEIVDARASGGTILLYHHQPYSFPAQEPVELNVAEMDAWVRDAHRTALSLTKNGDFYIASL